MGILCPEVTLNNLITMKNTIKISAQTNTIKNFEAQKLGDSDMKKVKGGIIVDDAVSI